MRQATTGDTVRVHYCGTLADGTEFDNSADRDPIEITIGNGEVIPGFEAALVGMAAGDMKNITIDANDAYGPRNPELVQRVERSNVPSEIDLEVGTVLQATGPDGNQLKLLVIELDEDNVTLDANHELAGEALTFELQLVDFVS